MSLQQICDELIKNNVPTPLSKTRHWGKENVKIILTNENYIGINTYTDKSKDPHRRDPKRFPFPNKDYWRIYKNTSPRIIDDETWNKVSKRLDKRISDQPKDNTFFTENYSVNVESSGLVVGIVFMINLHHCLNNERKYFKNVLKKTSTFRYLF